MTINIEEKELIGKTEKEAMSILFEKAHDEGLNTCDKCSIYDWSENFVWITADDFTPKEGEVLKPETYQKYDALCESCYKEELQ